MPNWIKQPDHGPDGFEAGVIRCRCGEPLELDDPMTNTCNCGAEYNGAGQRLAPREQWGEETGETAADIEQFRNDLDTPNDYSAGSYYEDFGADR